MRTQGLCLSVLAGLLLVCQSVATASESKTLIFATDPREELTRDQMNEQLNRVDPKEVARVLSQAKDKFTTKVTGGLTVERLLGQNEVSTSQCTRRAIRERLATCDRTKNFTNVNLYCRQCLLEAAKFCVEQMAAPGQDNLIDPADGRWLLGLAAVVQPRQQFGLLRNPLEHYLAGDDP